MFFTDRLRRDLGVALVTATGTIVLTFGLLVGADILPIGGSSAAIGYDGHLERDGHPVSGDYDLLIGAYDSQGEGATLLWQEVHQAVTVSAGRFHVGLGTGSPSQTATPHGTIHSALVAQADVYLRVGVAQSTGGPAPTDPGDYLMLAGGHRLESASFAHRGAPGHSFVVDGDLTAGGVIRATAVTGEGTIPAGMIAMFNDTCPTGWTRFTALDDRFPRGAAIPGTTGGSPAHTHGVPLTGHSITEAAGWGRIAGTVHGWDGKDEGIISDITTSSEGHLPPYYEVVWCQKDAYPL